ncbi:GHKL domain-containing protein [Candidatus Dependentiae bacterium]|nr:GHKL domain-containing protein [Candidatus Dependentiae bacterium]
MMKNSKKIFIYIMIPVLLLIFNFTYTAVINSRVKNINTNFEKEVSNIESQFQKTLDNKLKLILELLKNEFTGKNFKTKPEIRKSFDLVERNIARNILNIPISKFLYSIRYFSDNNLIIYKGVLFPIDQFKINNLFENKDEPHFYVLRDKLYNKIIIFNIPVNETDNIFFFILFEDTLNLYPDFYKLKDCLSEQTKNCIEIFSKNTSHDRSRLLEFNYQGETRFYYASKAEIKEIILNLNKLKKKNVETAVFFLIIFWILLIHIILSYLKKTENKTSLIVLIPIFIHILCLTYLFQKYETVEIFNWIFSNNLILLSVSILFLIISVEIYSFYKKVVEGKILNEIIYNIMSLVFSIFFIYFFNKSIVQFNHLNFNFLASMDYKLFFVIWKYFIFFIAIILVHFSIFLLTRPSIKPLNIIIRDKIKSFKAPPMLWLWSYLGLILVLIFVNPQIAGILTTLLAVGSLLTFIDIYHIKQSLLSPLNYLILIIIFAFSISFVSFPTQLRSFFNFRDKIIKGSILQSLEAKHDIELDLITKISNQIEDELDFSEIIIEGDPSFISPLIYLKYFNRILLSNEGIRIRIIDVRGNILSDYLKNYMVEMDDEIKRDELDFKKNKSSTTHYLIEETDYKKISFFMPLKDKENVLGVMNINLMIPKKMHNIVQGSTRDYYFNKEVIVTQYFDGNIIDSSRPGINIPYSKENLKAIKFNNIIYSVTYKEIPEFGEVSIAIPKLSFIEKVQLFIFNNILIFIILFSILSILFIIYFLFHYFSKQQTHHYKLSFQHQLTLILIFLLLVPLFSGISLFRRNYFRIQKENIYNQSLNRLVLLEDTIRNRSINILDNFLKQIEEENLIAGDDYNFLGSNIKIFEYNSFKDFDTSIISNTFLTGLRYKSYFRFQNRKLYLFYFTLLRDKDNEVTGTILLGLEIDENFFSELIKIFPYQISIFRGRILYLTNNQEIFLSGYITSEIPYENFSNLYRNKNFDSLMFKFNKKDYYLVFLTLLNDNKEYIGSLAILDQIFPETEEGTIDTYLYKLVTFSYLLFIIILVISYLLTLFISKPLNELLKATKEIQDENLDYQIEYRGAEDIQVLIDEFNKMIIELRETRKELINIERLKAWKEIAKKIAHEIKNPLTPIKLTIEHLITLYQDNPKEFDKLFLKATENILEQVDNLKDISDEFSTFGRIAEPKKKKTNLTNLINEIILLYIGRGENEGIKLESDIEDNVFVFADERMIKRVLINLLDNALGAFIDIKGTIKLELKSDKEFIYLKVIDNGVGINDNVIEKIFEPNFSTKKAGMGLGLGIVKEILEKHDGAISISSKHGKETIVLITIPRFE